jgi:hypothetical protein
MSGRKVTVRYTTLQGKIDYEFADMGVYYDDCGIVISCDENGLVEVFSAVPISDTEVLIKDGIRDLSSDNPELVIGLIAGDIVTVQFIYEGKSLSTENRSGVLVKDNRVFICDDEGPGIYAAQPTSDPKTVIVNLDRDSTDYLANNAALLLDLVTE